MTERTLAQRRVIARKALMSEDAWPTLDEVQETIAGVRLADRESWRREPRPVPSPGFFERNHLETKYRKRQEYWDDQVRTFQWNAAIAKRERERVAWEEKKKEEHRQYARERYRRLKAEKQEAARQQWQEQPTTPPPVQPQYRREPIIGPRWVGLESEPLKPGSKIPQAKPTPYEYQPFPRWKYHVSGKAVIVDDIAAARALGLWWFNTPLRAEQALELYWEWEWKKEGIGDA